MSVSSEIQVLPDERIEGKSDIKVSLLGASFETNNMGVSALAESSIKLILNRWPDAEITFIGSGYESDRHQLSIMGREISILTIPIRLSKNILLPYHILWFVFYGLLSKITPGSWFKKNLTGRNPYFRVLYESDIIVDITGGDSFSDIYGKGRFFRGFLQKWLMIFLRKRLILLPQTYGPFNRKLSRTMARYIMKRAHMIYSRDQEGMEYTNKLLNANNRNEKIRFAPDVAFVLDAHEFHNTDTKLLDDVRTTDTIVVGFNISGLLFNGGYTQDNMFALRTDYQELVYSIIDYLLRDKNILVVLVPHVFTAKGNIESDIEACRQVYEKMSVKYADRILMLHQRYNHNEIKYLIGECEFFLGSRMHSCIAAMSQCVPAVGLAYSKKFKGVFETVGLEGNVIDIRYAGIQEIQTTISDVFSHRKEITSKLKTKIPEIQQQLFKIFDNISL